MVNLSWFADLWEKFIDALEKIPSQFYVAFIKDDRWRYIVNGLGDTLRITFFALILGVVLGVVVALVRSSWEMNFKNGERTIGRAILGFFNVLCNIYLTVVRGTPVVVQLMIIYFIIMGSSSNSVLAGVISFGINSGAYVAEIVRGGIMSIDPGQNEAGRSLGFGYAQTMWYIILPQTFKNVLPALANEFIVLLKETAVIGYAGGMDLMRGSLIIRGVTYQDFFPLIVAALIYLALVMFFTRLVSLLERRLRASER